MKERWTLGISILCTLLVINVDQLIAAGNWTQKADSRHASGPVDGDNLSNENARHSLRRNSQIFFRRKRR